MLRHQADLGANLPPFSVAIKYALFRTLSGASIIKSTFYKRTLVRKILMLHGNQKPKLLDLTQKSQGLTQGI